MFTDEVNPEEEEKIIQNAADFFYQRSLEFPAVIILDFFKPFSFIGGSFAYFFLSPLTPIIGEEINKYLSIFKKKNNIEKVIVLIENKVKERKKGEKLLKKKL